MSDSLQLKKNIRLTVIGVILFSLIGLGGFIHKITSPRILSTQDLTNNGAIVFDKPRIFSGVNLIDHNGQPFTEDRLVGKWTIILFGFTSCPDICPTTLATLNTLYNNMKESERKQVQIVMVSVDPERDTQQKLATYLPFFNEQFIGVTGNKHFIRKLAAELNVAYSKVPLDDGDYTMDHSGHLPLINPYGHYHGFFKHQNSSSQILLSWRSIDATLKTQ
jgi:protein SCO1/2